MSVFKNTKKYLLLSVFAILMAPFIMPASQADAIVIARERAQGRIWQSQEIQIDPGTRYIFTDQYKSDATSEIDIRYTLTDDTYLTVRVEQFGSSKKWAPAQINFATFINAKSMVIMHVPAPNSHLIAKDFTLTKE